MIPGDFQFKKPPKGKMLLGGLFGVAGLVGFAVTALVLTWVISAWLDRPVVFGFDEGPDQPIAFPHTVHVQALGLDCTFCHRNVEKGAAATVPALGLCMTCHKTVGDGKEEVEKLRAEFEAGRAIDWVRVHRVPDHVRFVHEAHVWRFSGARTAVELVVDPRSDIRLEEARKIRPDAQIGQLLNIAASETCTICHGDVGDMVKVKQARTLKMDDCVDCHRANDGPTDCTTCHY